MRALMINREFFVYGLICDILQRNTVKFSRVSDFVPDFTSLIKIQSQSSVYISVNVAQNQAKFRGIICFHYALSIDVKESVRKMNMSFSVVQ